MLTPSLNMLGMETSWRGLRLGRTAQSKTTRPTSCWWMGTPSRDGGWRGERHPNREDPVRVPGPYADFQRMDGWKISFPALHGFRQKMAGSAPLIMGVAAAGRPSPEALGPLFSEGALFPCPEVSNFSRAYLRGLLFFAFPAKKEDNGTKTTKYNHL